MISGYLSKAAEGHAEEELASPNTVSNIPQDESIHRGAPHNTLPSNRSLINAEPIDRSVPANMASQTLRADNVVSLDRGRILRDDSPPVSKIPPAHAVAGSEGREVGFPPDPATLPPSTAGQRLKRTGRRSQALRSEFQAQASGAGSSKKRKRDSATHSPSPDPNDASAYSHPAEEASSSPNRGGKSKEVLRPVARERGHDDELDDPPHPSTFTSPPHEALLNINKSDIRSIGVHSAVALFRRPSESSMKYARPPMSKLFASLELSPENFLHLQAAAKTYMLNDDYPERRECVGNRGKGDSDMVKLRLYNCANEFLEGEGNGERYFGRDVAQEGVARRRLIWPEQKQSILAAVTPLLRRMVTNERQRRYAVETRAKAGGPESKKRKADDAGLNESEPEMEVDQRRSEPRERVRPIPSIDPHLRPATANAPATLPRPIELPPPTEFAPSIELPSPIELPPIKLLPPARHSFSSELPPPMDSQARADLVLSSPSHPSKRPKLAPVEIADTRPLPPPPPPPPTIQLPVSPEMVDHALPPHAHAHAPPPRNFSGMTIHLNILSGSSRRHPRTSLDASLCPTLASLEHYLLLQRHHADPPPTPPLPPLPPHSSSASTPTSASRTTEAADDMTSMRSIQVLTEHGLVPVHDDTGWLDVLAKIHACVWMDDQVRVVARF